MQQVPNMPSSGPQPQYIHVQPQYTMAGNQSPMTIGVPYPKTQAQLALILSIISLFAGGICLSIPSLMIANNAMSVAVNYPGHPDYDSAKYARIISFISIGLSMIGLIFIASVIGLSLIHI